MPRLEPDSRIPAGGVYAIQSKSMGWVYVGSGKNLHSRYSRLFRSGPNFHDATSSDAALEVTPNMPQYLRAIGLREVLHHLCRSLHCPALRLHRTVSLTDFHVVADTGGLVDGVPYSLIGPRHSLSIPLSKAIAPRLLAARQSAHAYRQNAHIQARTHKADMDFEASFREGC